MYHMHPELLLLKISILQLSTNNANNTIVQASNHDLHVEIDDCSILFPFTYKRESIQVHTLPVVTVFV